MQLLYRRHRRLQSIISLPNPMDTSTRSCLCCGSPLIQSGPSGRSWNHTGRSDDSLPSRLTPKWARSIWYPRPTYCREETLPDLQRILHCYARVSNRSLNHTRHDTDDYLGFSPRTSSVGQSLIIHRVSSHCHCVIIGNVNRFELRLPVCFERERGKYEESDGYCWRQVNRQLFGSIVELKKGNSVTLHIFSTHPTL